MPGPTYFVQECNTCGRNLQVRVEYLGKRVVCQHCGAKFSAHAPGTDEAAAESSLSLLARADELIRQSGIHLANSSTQKSVSEAI